MMLVQEIFFGRVVGLLHRRGGGGPSQGCARGDDGAVGGAISGPGEADGGQGRDGV